MINAFGKKLARSSDWISKLKTSFKKIRITPIVNTPIGRVSLLTSVYFFQIVIIVHYIHIMVFHIAIL